MKPEEIVAEKYLRRTYGENLTYEPLGGNTSPDFSINDIYAVEVRRLNQQFFDGEDIEGLENLSSNIYKPFIEVLNKFNSQYLGKSYAVDIEFKRPFTKNMKETKMDMHSALETFLRTETPLPCALEVNEKIKFHIDMIEPINNRVFLMASESDLDWLVHDASIIKNIQYCITQKSLKAKQYKSLYKECWLCLVDQVVLEEGYRIESIKSAISDLGEFNKVVIINYTGEHRLLDIVP
jgi:hypothetical protein